MNIIRSINFLRYLGTTLSIHNNKSAGNTTLYLFA